MSEQHTEAVILGAGPAGLQMGYLLQKSRREYVILEKADKSGSFFEKYPLHDKLLSINKVYSPFDESKTPYKHDWDRQWESPQEKLDIRSLRLRLDWNSLLCDSDEMLFKEFSKDYFPDKADLVRYLNAFSQHYDLNIEYGCHIQEIQKGACFRLRDATGKVWTCDYLFVATGLFTPYLPDIPGIEEAEHYVDHVVDPERYIGERVLVIGKGNSALEVGNALLGTSAYTDMMSPNPISLAWRSHFVGHVRAVNASYLDSYNLKSLNTIFNVDILNIRKRNGLFEVRISFLENPNGFVDELTYDRVIACTGFRFDDSIFGEGCKPELCINDRFPKMTEEWESTSVENLYFIGVLMQSRDYKQKQSAFIHGFRYNIEVLHRIVEEKHFGNPLPHDEVRFNAVNLTNSVLRRISNSSYMWQQTGFIGDALVVKDGVVMYYENLTKDIVLRRFREEELYYYITINFAQEVFDSAVNPFRVPRRENEAIPSAQAHPIIYKYSNGELVDTAHFPSDFVGVWLYDLDFNGDLFNYWAKQVRDFYLGEGPPRSSGKTDRSSLVEARPRLEEVSAGAHPQHLLDELQEFKGFIEENFVDDTCTVLGAPANLGVNVEALSSLLHLPLNNLGDPYVESYGNDTHRFEREVLSFFADLYGIDPEAIWGYVASGGTEAVVYGLWMARELYPNGVLYFSSESHYSVFKAARLLRVDAVVVPTLENGEIDYDVLGQRISEHGDRPVIMNVNVGTTVKGAIDDVGKIIEVFVQRGVKSHYIHADAALLGMILPFIDGAPSMNFESGINSLSVSGHKFIGAPMPCGVFLMEKRLYGRIDKAEVPYLHDNCMDITLLGSRNGHAPLILWYLIKTKRYAGFKREVEECMANKEYLVQEFRRIGYPCWTSRYSNVVWFDEPPDELVQKWILLGQDGKAHVVVMPHVTREKIDRLVEEMKAARDLAESTKGPA